MGACTIVFIKPGNQRKMCHGFYSDSFEKGSICSILEGSSIDATMTSSSDFRDVYTIRLATTKSFNSASSKSSKRFPPLYECLVSFATSFDNPSPILRLTKDTYVRPSPIVCLCRLTCSFLICCVYPLHCTPLS
jgi:hypothetical protein